MRTSEGSPLGIKRPRLCPVMVLELQGYSTDGNCKVAVSTGTLPPGESVRVRVKGKCMN